MLDLSAIGVYLARTFIECFRPGGLLRGSGRLDRCIFIMEKLTLKSDALLLLTAVIWGSAFVAQRVGMDFIGPFTYSGVRFALGCMVLLPLIIAGGAHDDGPQRSAGAGVAGLVPGGCLAGLFLFAGVSLQQVGLVYTTAGKAGFITGLYVVIVPILGLFWKKPTHLGTWIGAVLAAAGLYFLSVTESFTISFGDFLELVGAFFWAAHVQVIGWLSPRNDALKLALVQYAFCSLLSMAVALVFETITLSGLIQAAVPILYGGVLSVGVAYTLQVIAQRNAPPAHAAILLSLEAAFAALAGWLILGELLDARGILGCTLMLAGMLLSQLWGMGRIKNLQTTAAP